ncbi:endosialidase-like protein [Roseivirga pacifica]|uniref:tail fiber domain-containing protein n=1 Tax=Roseivirga pacifica TaxID=1267423 RepID=UPI000EB5ED6C|nr:tail fiber domain-containing protein [Roseivirga pacifica]RKQ43271.1 endosialidase-like protein [Roseivirga pacifica]
MKRFAAFAVLFFILSCHAIRAQVGIGSEEFVPDESSILELRSDSKGLLIPRLTRDQRDRMDNPSTGLLIYQTDLESGFYFYNGEKWVSILASDGTIVQDYQSIAFDPVTYMLTLENGGQVDLSVLRFGRSLEQTVDNGDGTITFNYNDGTSFTTIDLRGSKGDKGDDGLDGRTILSGNTDPNSSEGSEGDFYINTASSTFFGPKTNTGWGTGTSLKGDQGPAGVNGADGADGTNGTDGADGKDGNSFLNGTGAPAATLGQDGDFYIDTNANTYYGPKTAGAWGTPTSLVGPSGADGADGVDGTNGTDGLDGKDGNSFLNGTGVPAATLGQDGDFYVDTNANTYYGPKTAGTWGAATSLVGPAGADGIDGINGTDGVDGKDGNSFLNGTGAPAATLGQDGDFYVDTNANTYYGPKTAGAWGAATSLVGPAGADGIDGINGTDGVDGKDGNSFLNGTGAPAATLGQDGDFYVDTNANTYYGPKTAGAWGAPTSLVGPAGADGVDGTNGTDGVDGKDGNSFLNGAGAPAATLGQDGDFYVDTNANTYYGPKTAGAWGTATSLVGPAGADGADGIDGTNGVDGKDGNSFLNGTGAPAATLGQDGDFYVDTNANTYYGPKTAGAWGTATSLVGPAGADGADGIDGTNGTDGVDGKDGNSFLNGTGAPAATLGQDGDFYVDTNANTYYGPKSAGAWGAPTSLVGPAGADGADGIDGTNGTDGVDGKDGNSFLNGTGAPAATLGQDGDFYVDTNANTYYGPKSAGAWGAPTSLVGPAGADGADGIDGTSGTDGVDGINGTDGVDGKSMLNGTGAPANTLGNNGDFYIDTNTNNIYGPKTAGTWGAATSLIGPAGADGTDGVDGIDGTNGTDGIDGKSMLNGTGAPAATLGIDGDIYFDTDANAIYGPKTAGAWGAATSLVGPAGADGANGTDGIDGIDGIDGSSILSGTSNPIAANGTDGDFYINTSSLQIFGPKTGGAWGTATPLQGNGIQSTMDNPDGSITFTYTDGTSFTTQPDGDFSTTNELITGIALVNKTLQIREAGITKTVDLSPVSTTSKLVDTDLNTTIDVDEGGFNDDIIRFTVGGAEKMRLTGRTLEVLNNSSSINIGKDAGINGTGAGNILLGDEAAYANTSGNNNIAIGYRALRQNSTGNGNVAIGYYAGYNETGNNKLYIENSNNPNPLIWGDFSTDVVNVNGKLGIGLLNPGGITNELEVNGHATVISLTETSDKRFKQNIEVITNPIDAIKLINGVRYDWRIDEFPNRRFKTGKNIGFIAQEVRAVFPELVSESSDGYLSVSYSGLTPILVEAVKDQQETIESQAQIIDELKTMLLELKKETEKLSEEVSKLKEANATKDK